jgi:predicted ATPase
MKINPFTPNSPVHKSMFVGRLRELDAIDRALGQAKYGNPTHILLIGERGIGKTSLLNVVSIFAKGEVQWRDDKFNFLAARMNLSDNLDLVDFATNLRSCIEREIDKNHPQLTRIKKAWDFISRFEVGGVAYKQENRSKNDAQLVQDFVYSLSDTIKSLKDPALGASAAKEGLVILIDEVDKSSPDLRLGSFLKNLTEILAAENCNNILIVLSGLPDVRDVLTSSHESSLRLFHEFDLNPLSKAEVREVIERGLAEAGKNSGQAVTIDDDAQELIYTFSEGYPHFVQQIGYSVFEVDEDNVIKKEDVNKGVFMEHGALELIGDRYYVKPFYKDITVDSQREILSIMAEKWNGWVTREEIKSKFSGGVTTMNNGLRALREKGIIIPREGFKGQYRLQWASFAFWIKNHKKTERRT